MTIANVEMAKAWDGHEGDMWTTMPTATRPSAAASGTPSSTVGWWRRATTSSTSGAGRASPRATRPGWRRRGG